jgi:hypothetical protein
LFSWVKRLFEGAKVTKILETGNLKTKKGAPETEAPS